MIHLQYKFIAVLSRINELIPETASASFSARTIRAQKLFAIIICYNHEKLDDIEAKNRNVAQYVIRFRKC